VTGESGKSAELGEFDRKLGIEISEAGPDRVVGDMPVEGNTQIYGRLHGGATLAFGEALGSCAADLHARSIGKTAVGVDVNGTHHRPAREGVLTGVATALHLGRRSTCHEVVVTDAGGARVATIRITTMLIDRSER
jgi:uncharacterized protein (TIGR00369 family)